MENYLRATVIIGGGFMILIVIGHSTQSLFVFGLAGLAWLWAGDKYVKKGHKLPWEKPHGEDNEE